MTKDEAIRILKNAAWLGSNDEREATEEAVDMAVDVLRDCDKCAMASINAITLLQNTIKEQWIPCSERLPKEERKTYWVCTDTEYQCECRWTNDRFGIGEGEWGWSIFDTPRYTKPIAWMPLPEAYKGGE